MDSMNCTATYSPSGAPRHAKPVPAKYLVIRDYPSARVAVHAKTGADVTAEAIQQIEASDGRWVVIEEAVCGTHFNSLKHGTLTVPVDALFGSPELDIDYVKRRYERTVEQAAARRAADAKMYEEHRQDEYDNVTFEIEEKVDRREEIAGWLITSVEADRGKRPVAHVAVEASEGRAWVRIGEYMNSGRGRGSLHYTHTLMDVYKLAITAAVKWNEAHR